MYQAAVHRTVAVVIVLGHLLIVAYGFYSLVLFGPNENWQEGLQVVLMASPVLAVSAVSGFRFVLQSGTSRRRGKKVNALYVAAIFIVPLILISFVLFLINLVYTGRSDIGLDGLKIGSVETIFGVFIGMISEFAFGSGDESE